MSDAEIEDGHGNKSAIRITLRWSRKWGAILIVTGGLALAIGVIVKYDPAITAAIAFASLGAGLPSAIGAAKAYQSKHEGG